MTKQALIIGIDKYTHKDLALPSCKKDALDMYDLLSNKLEYDIYRNGPLIGSNLGKGSAIKITDAISKFFKQAGPDQDLLFYFSGHAFRGSEGVYLATPEIDPEDPHTGGFLRDILVQKANQCSAYLVICIIDACYSAYEITPFNTLFQPMSLDDEKNSIASEQSASLKSVEKLLTNRGRFFLLSSQGRSFAPKMRGTRVNNSIFSRYVIEGLGGIMPETGTGKEYTGSVDSKGRVTPRTLYTYVRSAIEKKHPGLQKPDIVTRGDESAVALAEYPRDENSIAAFKVQKNYTADLSTVVNVEQALSGTKGWSFNRERLLVQNNRHWRCVPTKKTDLGPAGPITSFWIRFSQSNGKVVAIRQYARTTRFEKGAVSLKNHQEYGQVLLVKYTSYPRVVNYAAYDLLKIVDKNKIRGLSFVGSFPDGIPVRHFNMLRSYGTDLLEEDDHERLFQKYGRVPRLAEIHGGWNATLVSDNFVVTASDSPDMYTKRFHYTDNNFGNLRMDNLFGELLHQEGYQELSGQQGEKNNFSDWHEEVKLIAYGFAVCKWCSPYNYDQLESGSSLIRVETTPKGNRFCLRFNLLRPDQIPEQ